MIVDCGTRPDDVSDAMDRRLGNGKEKISEREVNDVICLRAASQRLRLDVHAK